VAQNTGAICEPQRRSSSDHLHRPNANELASNFDSYAVMLPERIMVLLLAFVLTGCAADRLKAPTKCDAVTAVLSNPSTTRRQEEAAMEMGRNNHYFGN
jgi:hypothetical protein